MKTKASKRILSILLSMMMLISSANGFVAYADENPVPSEDSAIVTSSSEEDNTNSTSTSPLGETDPNAPTDEQQSPAVEPATETPLAASGKPHMAVENYKGVIQQEVIGESDKLLAGDVFSGKITLDLGKYQGSETNYQIQLRIPKEYAQYNEKDLKVNIKDKPEATQTTYVDGDFLVLEIRLENLNSTYAASIPYEFKLLPRFTPQFYQVTPQVTLHVERDEQYEQIGVANDVIYKALYNPVIDFDKSVLNQDDGYGTTYRRPEVLAYAGKSNEKGFLPEDEAQLIPTPFYFSFSTAAYNSSTKSITGADKKIAHANGQSYGNGLGNTQFAEKIVLEDTLPTYLDANNVTRTAVLAPGKNEGWTVENGVATYTATATAEAIQLASEGKYNQITPDMAADRQIYQGKVALWLLFPGAPATTIGKYNLNNHVKATIYPTNPPIGSDSYTVEPQVMEDSLPFGLAKEPYSTNGLFIKNSNDRFQVPFYDQFMHGQQAGYGIRVANKTQFPMKNIVIEDRIFDSETYLKSFFFQDDPGDNIQEVYLEYANGRKVVINEGQSFTKGKLTILDQETIKAIEKQVAEVQAGSTTSALDKARVTRPSDDVAKKLVIVMKPEFTLESGKSFGVFLNMGFSHPYGLKNTKPIINNGRSDQIKNQANLTANLFVDPNKPEPLDLSSESFVTLYEKGSKIILEKVISTNEILTVDNNIYYRIKLDLNNLPPSLTIKDPVFVDVLPKGFKPSVITQNDHAGKEFHNEFFGTMRYDFDNPQSVEDNKGVFTLEEDYQGTGRQAVIIKLKGDISVEKIKLLGFYMSGTVTSEAIPTGNDNEVFFTAGNWGNIQEMLSIKPNEESVTLVDDKYDVNKDNNVNDKVLMASATFNTNLGTKIEAVKSIKKESSVTWSRTGIDTLYGENFEYKLAVLNNQEDLKQLMIYDIFPKTDDKNYIGETPRQSQFSNTLRGAVRSEQDNANYNFFYSEEANPSSTFDGKISGSQWKTVDQLNGDFSKVTAIVIQLKDGKELKSNEPLSFIVPMKAPAFDNDRDISTKKAINNFAIKYTNRDSFGQSNSVYNQMPMMVKAEKQWDIPKGFESSIPHDKVSFSLYKNGVLAETVKAPMGTSYRFADEASNLLVEGNKAVIVWSELASKDDSGKPIVWTVKEVHFAEEYTDKTEAKSNSFVITNTLMKLDVIANKNWVNAPAGAKPEIVIQLWRSTSEAGEQQLVKELPLAKDKASVTFEKVDRFNKEGVEYFYFVKEKEVPKNYTMSVSGNTITNTYKDPTVPPTPGPGPGSTPTPNPPSPVRPTPPDLTIIDEPTVPLTDNQKPSSVVDTPITDKSIDDSAAPKDGITSIKNVPKTGVYVPVLSSSSPVDILLPQGVRLKDEDEITE